MPTVSIDYFLMGPSGQEEEQGVLPMVVMESHKSRMSCSHVVERKGLVDSAMRRFVGDLVRIVEIGVQVRSGPIVSRPQASFSNISACR